jgi:Ca2+-transporting ATPase
MAKGIIGVGIAFVFLLFGLVQYFKHETVESLVDFDCAKFVSNFFNFGSGDGLSPYELSLFFTIFVMLQFWNMFNAKAFMTGKSAFKSLKSSSGFLFIAIVILAGQWVIVTLGGEMFNVMPLQWKDWGIIIAVSSIVLWIGEIARLIRK